jgi:D-glycero-alpha-D-manno-heptose 1-phosphate guanylyltransferase
MGTRLQSVVSDVPKPLAPVNGRPFLDLLLAQLDGFRQVQKVVLAIGYKATLVQARYADCKDYELEIEFSVESTPLGTGGAIRQAFVLTGSPNVLVLNGDSDVDFNLGALVEIHTRHDACITMVVTEVADTSRFGSVVVDAATSKVLQFREKTLSAGRGLINAGCYLLKRSAFETLPTATFSFEKDVLPRFLSSTYALAATGRFIDIGVPESYRLAGEYLR